MEISTTNVNVADVDDASSRLNQLVIPSIQRVDIELRRIAAPSVLHLLNDEEPSISSLYDDILHSWIAPLPPEVPVRIRQHKERVARRIAAEVMLASFRVRQVNDAPDLRPAPSHDDGILLPTLQEEPELGSASQWSSQSQMTAAFSMPSSQPPSSPPVSGFFSARTVADPLTRLRGHLHISDDAPTNISPSVTQLLAHWQLGADPHVYDWDATERAVRPDVVDDISQEQREKERKRKERREKRQKREDELMRAKTVIQPSLSRSSPGPMFGDMPSSSQVPSQLPSQMSSQMPHLGHVSGGSGGFGSPGGFGSMMPQSQVESGGFGGRPDKKKKKGKGRISGF
jgi:RNA polymerase I-specific transcription initiation factor RRN6